MVKQYETTFIVDAHLQTEQIESTVNKYTELIEKSSGKIKLIDRWGKRRLAYEIAKKQYGYYVYVRFEAPGEIVDTLEKEFKLDESILRHLVLRVPKVVLREESKQSARAEAEAEAGAEVESEATDANEDVESAENGAAEEEEPAEEPAAAPEEAEADESASEPEESEEKPTAEDA